MNQLRECFFENEDSANINHWKIFFQKYALNFIVSLIFLLGFVFLAALAFLLFFPRTASSQDYKNIHDFFKILGIIFYTIFIITSLCFSAWTPLFVAFGFVEIDLSKNSLARYLLINGQRFLTKEISINDLTELRNGPSSYQYKNYRTILGIYGPNKRVILLKISKSPSRSRIIDHLTKQGIKTVLL